MGSILNERRKAWVRSWSGIAWLAVSVIALGLGLLVYQTIAHYSGNSIPKINFDIGSLWEDRSEAAVNVPIAESDVVVRILPEADRLDVLRPAVPVQQLPPMRIRAKTPVIQDAVMPSAKTELFQEPEGALPSINLLALPLPADNEVERMYIKQLEQDHVFDPDFTPERGKWFVDLSFAPSLSFRTFDYKDDMAGKIDRGGVSYIFGMTEGFRERTDRPMASFYYGASVGRSLHPVVDLVAGIFYSVYGEDIQVSRISPDQRENIESDYYGSDPIYLCPEDGGEEVITYSNRFKYIEIPLSVRVSLLRTGKTSLGAELGVHLQKLDHVSALIYDFHTDYYYWLPDQALDIYNSYGWGSLVGLNVSQFITSKTEVFLHPQWKMNQAHTFTDDYPVEQRQYSYGVQLGVRRHFADNSH